MTSEFSGDRGIVQMRNWRSFYDKRYQVNCESILFYTNLANLCCFQKKNNMKKKLKIFYI